MAWKDQHPTPYRMTSKYPSMFYISRAWLYMEEKNEARKFALCAETDLHSRADGDSYGTKLSTSPKLEADAGLLSVPFEGSDWALKRTT